MAGAAIGVSHLVQSTRAGAEFGWLIAPAIVVACVVKYPFLQFGPRYAAAAGESLIAGYRRLGLGAVALFSLITLGTMFTTLAGVTAVTAGLGAGLFGILPDVRFWSVAVLGACILLLLAGRYAALDTAMKVIMGVLGASTLLAVVLAFLHASPATAGAGPSPYTFAALPFLIALMGWMPVPIDVAVWHSLWTLERGEQKQHRATLGQALGDFNIGYAIAFMMALLFLALGALLMFGTGERFAAGALPFSEQLISLYTRTLGAGAGPLIMLAAFTTMFSTTLAVTDAYPRVVAGVWRSISGQPASAPAIRRVYAAALIAVPSGAVAILWFFAEQMTTLVDVATTLAFLSAPILGWMNLRVVTSRHMPEQARPSRAMRIFSWTGLAFLTVLAAAFLFVFVRA